jgi:hypothetical protein
MSDYQMSENKSLDDLLNEAVDLTDNRVSYSTNIRFRVSNNDVTLDFYYLAPDPKNPTGLPTAQRLHRIILPVGLAKNIGQLLANAMDEWESTFGVTLPLLPEQGEKDNANS